MYTAHPKLISEDPSDTTRVRLHVTIFQEQTMHVLASITILTRLHHGNALIALYMRLYHCGACTNMARLFIHDSLRLNC